jgi:MFS family permease
MSTGVKGVESLGGMVAWRFCLGIAEAGFFPGVMFLMSCWYKVRLAHDVELLALD